VKQSRSQRPRSVLGQVLPDLSPCCAVRAHIRFEATAMRSCCTCDSFPARPRDIQIRSTSMAYAQSVAEFVTFLEQRVTTALGLAMRARVAIHTLVRFAAAEHPERMAELQRVLAVPFKRNARRDPIEYLESSKLRRCLRCRSIPPRRTSEIMRCSRSCSIPARASRKYWIFG
jgi:hypothetical protein